MIYITYNHYSSSGSGILPLYGPGTNLNQCLASYLGFLPASREILLRLIGLGFFPRLNLRHVSTSVFVSRVTWDIHQHLSPHWPGILPSPRPKTHLNQRLASYLRFPPSSPDNFYHYTIHDQCHYQR
ncbi:hypothetical protein E6C27_scaffold418G00190 [Cucumis melo var. makuwa]|uniref:Uncharacterized protein n=1 Tax=Cucumis melo var. makuwa TaxID=1194695 RepID=A0A5A7VIM9_CUCMM|nr:hypothetical protein E6C27_scaffold418G00190 [Cucumis melo var. makuwa]